MAARVDMDGRVISLTPTVTAGAEHANDCLGGKLTLNDVMLVDSGYADLFGVCLTDAANQKVAMEIVIFNDNPTAATLTDNAAIAFSTDLAKVQARIPIETTDWATVGGVGIADKAVLRQLQCASGNKLYAAIMAVGAPTFVAATDLTIKFRFNREK